MKAVLRNLRNASRRARDSYLGYDEANLRRLKRAGRVTVGVWSYGAPVIKTFMHDTTCMRVGSYTSWTGTYVLGGKHGTDRVTTYPLRIWFGMPGAGTDGFPTPTGDLVIGSDVWVCTGALVVSGLTIGHGAIVGAGAVVTRDVPPYAIVAGNPAKLVRYRFNEEQIAALLDIRWWDWPEAEVREAVPLLADKDVDAFISWAYARRGQAPLRQ